MPTGVIERGRCAGYAYAILEVAIEAKQKVKHIWIVDDNQNLESEIIGI